MVTHYSKLPKGTKVVTGGVQMGTPLLNDLLSHDTSNSRFNEEARTYLLEKVRAFRNAHEEDFSCGVALSVTRGTRSGFEPYDLDIKTETYIAELLVEGIKA